MDEASLGTVLVISTIFFTGGTHGSNLIVYIPLNVCKQNFGYYFALYTDLKRINNVPD